MRCDECPFKDITDEYACAPIRFLDEHDCHLATADFPIIRAMIVGELKCSTCSPVGWCPESELPERGYEITTYPCKAWHPTEER